MIQIQLKTSSIMEVPLDILNDHFSFIVNGKVFITNRLIAYLLSPLLCKNHFADQTLDKFVINTQNQGNFLYFLKLSQFNEIICPDSEVPFISEVIEILGNTFIDFKNPNEFIEITEDNVISLIKQHEKSTIFYSQLLSKEIDFISSHFYKICESHSEKFKEISLDTLQKIIEHDHFQLEAEDQLLELINKLYEHDRSIQFYTIMFCLKMYRQKLFTNLLVYLITTT